jgi:D-inositol-3-phosphate glycosyltransferase
VKKKSILIVDPVGIKAGMDYYDLNLAEALTANGVETYIASNFNKHERCLKFFESEKKETKAGKLKDLMTGFVKAIAFAKRKRISYILVHIFSTEAKDFLSISMVKAANLNLIAIAHDISSFANADSGWIKSMIFNKYADLLIVHNNYSFKALKEVVSKEIVNRMSIIPHGSFVNLAKADVTRDDARAELGIPSTAKVILFFGQIKKVKGLDVLLEAMPMINGDVTLVIAGKPWKDDFQTYADIIKKHGLESRVRLFIRYITDEERELFFKSADLLVIPYRKIYQSGVLLMGMSYMLPVIASDIEANRELIVKNKNGLLFEDGNAQDLAVEINRFFSGSNGQALAVNAYELLEKEYNWDIIAKKYIQVINENSNNRV